MSPVVVPGDDLYTIDLPWLELVSGGVDDLAERLGRMSDAARAARERGGGRVRPLAGTSTAAVVAEWLSYPPTELAPEDLLAELRRRCRSHARDAGPSIALLKRVLEHQERRLAGASEQAGARQSSPGNVWSAGERS